MDCQEIREDLRATVARRAPHRRKIRERRPPGLRSLASNMYKNICFPIGKYNYMCYYIIVRRKYL